MRTCTPALHRARTHSRPRRSDLHCPPPSPPALQILHSYFYVLTWMSISISVILFNKWLLAYSGFPYPITLTLWHMTFCTAVATLLIRVFKVVKSHNMSRKDYLHRVMPIGAWLAQASDVAPCPLPCMPPIAHLPPLP